MVDFASYKKLHAESSKKASRNYGQGMKRMPLAFMEQPKPPTDDLLYIFPPTITGYNLRRKRWRKYHSGHN